MVDSSKKKKYWAFISYSSKDKKWGQWLHKRLEHYPIPPALRGMQLFDGAVLGKNLRPIFRDRDELSGASDLGPEISRALAASRFLIVLCSPNSAKSQWVNKEIEDFKALDPEHPGRILALILEGEPNATNLPGVPDETECFPPALRQPMEPLAGDLRPDGDGKERGFLKILSGIAQVDFDELYKRHERARRKKRMLTGLVSGGIAVALAGLVIFALQQRKNAALQETIAAAQRELAAVKEREAAAQREIAEAKTREADENAREAAENDRRARMNLATKDLEAADDYRWSGDYAACFAYLSRSLRNNPEGVEASEIAWNLITGETPAYFPVSATPLPDDRIATRFIKHDTELVWLRSNGAVSWMKTSEETPYKTLELPDWDEVVGDNFTFNIMDVTEDTIQVELQINRGQPKYRYARYSIDRKTDKVRTNHSKEWVMAGPSSVVDAGLMSSKEANALAEATRAEAGPYRNGQPIPLSTRTKAKFKRYAENHSSDDLFLDVPNQSYRHHSVSLWIQKSGEAILLIGFYVTDHEVLPTPGTMFVEREMPKADHVDVYFLSYDDGQVRESILTATGELEEAGWAQNESGSHVLIWRGTDCVLIELDVLKSIAGSLYHESGTENWESLRRFAAASLVTTETPEQMGLSEDGDGIFVTTADSLMEFSHPSLQTRTRVRLPVSDEHLLGPFDAVLLNESSNEGGNPTHDGYPVKPVRASDQRGWAFFNRKLFNPGDGGQYVPVSDFPMVDRTPFWISGMHSWAVFGTSKNPRTTLILRDGLEIVTLTPPYATKTVSLPADRTEGTNVVIEDRNNVYIGGIAIPKAEPMEARPMPTDQVAEIYADYSGYAHSTLLERQGFRRLREKLTEHGVLHCSAPLFNAIGRGKDTIVYCQISPNSASGQDHTHQILTLSKDGQYILGIGGHGSRAHLSEDGSAAVVVDSIPQHAAMFWCPSPRDEMPPDWLAQFLEDYSGCTIAEDGTIAENPAKLKLGTPASAPSVENIPRGWDELRDLFEPSS